MLHMLHEMMSIIEIKKLGELIYVNLLKQLKFGQSKLYGSKYAL